MSKECMHAHIVLNHGHISSARMRVVTEPGLFQDFQDMSPHSLRHFTRSLQCRTESRTELCQRQRLSEHGSSCLNECSAVIQGTR
jgi:hypothetical protein